MTGCARQYAARAIAPDSGTRIQVEYTAPAKGFVSLALYNQSGTLVRSLLSAHPETAGAHTIIWDGTTDLGKPAQAGAYSARGIFFATPPSQTTVMEVGKSGNPPWRTPDGKGDWGGNMGAPTTIVSNGKSIISVYSCVEDNQITGIQQMDGAGNIQLRYFSFYGWDIRMAAAMDSRNLFLGVLNSEKKHIEIAEYNLGQPRGKILAVLPTQSHADDSETHWHGRWTAFLDGMAITDDAIYASVKADDTVFIVDRATGAIRKQISVPAPCGLAVSGERLLVVSQDKILRFGLDGQPGGAVVGTGALKAPYALTVDTDGTMYVGDSGESGGFGPRSSTGSRQVCVFSKTGSLLRRIGKPGGTPQQGRFDPDGLGVITGLCIGPDEDGRSALWAQDVATGFFRTSRWSLEGKLERQWFGRRLSLFSDSINPAHPDELIYTSNAFSDEPGITAYHLDWTNRTWRPAWHYDERWSDMFQKDVYQSFTHPGNRLNSAMGADAVWPTFDYSSRNFVTYQGHDYFMNQTSNGDGAIFLYGPGHKPTPVALVGKHRVVDEGGKLQSFYDQGPNNWFTWADRNGDGRMQSDELIVTKDPPIMGQTPRVSECRLDSHLNVTMMRYIKEGGKLRQVYSQLPLKELLPSGVPVYDWSQLRDLMTPQVPDFLGGDGLKTSRAYNMQIPEEADGAYYTLIQPNPVQKLVLPGIDGKGWWASRNWRTKVARFDKATGRCLWAVGRRTSGRAEPGEMYHPCWLAGVAGSMVFVTDTLGPTWVWNSDGLYVGHLGNDYNSGVEDDQTLYGEIQATGIYTDPSTGKIYAIANDTGAHIHEVTLPKLLPIKGGAVTLTADEAAKVAPWDPDGTVPLQHPEYRAFAVDHPMKIDGSMNDWSLGGGKPPIPYMTVMMDDHRLATVQVTYDRNNLYLAYQVTAPGGAANSGSELPYAPFVSGAYVDFTVAPHWNGPRSDTADGDVRVILARVKGPNGTQDFQQGFWQQEAGGENPRTITSPAAQAHFDQIAPVAGLKMAYQIGATDPKTGATAYKAEVSVPLASLGIASPAGKTIGFDVSVGVANAAGDRRERAAHWGGLSEGVVVDRPGSARLLPDTWGTLTFEK